jgi:hypothetical protein
MHQIQATVKWHVYPGHERSLGAQYADLCDARAGIARITRPAWPEARGVLAQSHPLANDANNDHEEYDERRHGGDRRFETAEYGGVEPDYHNPYDQRHPIEPLRSAMPSDASPAVCHIGSL